MYGMIDKEESGQKGFVRRNIMKGSRSVKTTAKQTVKKAAATAKKAAEPVVEATEAAVACCGGDGKDRC